MKNKKIIIVGGGPVGALTAIYLARRGLRTTIYERRPDPRLALGAEGRSINLALSRRGFDALEPVGLKDPMMVISTPMKGRQIHHLDGSLAFQPYGKSDEEVIYAVSRWELNRGLLSAAANYDEIELRFEERCLDINLMDGLANFRGADGKTHRVAADTIFGCDGVASAVRHSMSKMPGFNLSQEYIEYGYKELTIPAGEGGSFRMEKNALHIWPRGGYMLIALPNVDGSFTCTLFFPLEGAENFRPSFRKPEDVRIFFEHQFPDALPLIPDLTEAFFANPNGALPTIKCRPWHFGDKVLLLGDAAHGIVPFLGQGLNCALEGTYLLFECLDHQPDDWAGAFAAFSRTRKQDTDAVAEMALENFVEMRDSVADRAFLLRKRVELELEKRFYPRFISRYAIIQFHHLRYSSAQSQGQINEHILNELCSGVSSFEDLDWNQAEKLISEMLH